MNILLQMPQKMGFLLQSAMVAEAQGCRTHIGRILFSKPVCSAFTSLMVSLLGHLPLIRPPCKPLSLYLAFSISLLCHFTYISRSLSLLQPLSLCLSLPFSFRILSHSQSLHHLSQSLHLPIFFSHPIPLSAFPPCPLLVFRLLLASYVIYVASVIACQG